MLNYVEITNKNINYATKIQMKIFPDECAYQEYKDVINKNLEYQKYYLVYDNENVIGITGLYCFEDISVTNSIWLGWFGVLEEYRRKGYGKTILLDTIKKATEFSKKYPIKFFRLYTSERDNPIAQILYNEVMDIKEYYNNIDDFNYDNTCIIYSKSLNQNKATYWNNEFLNLKENIKKEEEGLNKFNNLKIKHKCPCCGYYTFNEKPDGTFEICPVCFWKYDNIQLKDPNFKGGTNWFH